MKKETWQSTQDVAVQSGRTRRPRWLGTGGHAFPTVSKRACPPAYPTASQLETFDNVVRQLHKRTHLLFKPSHDKNNVGEGTSKYCVNGCVPFSLDPVGLVLEGIDTPPCAHTVQLRLDAAVRGVGLLNAKRQTPNTKRPSSLRESTHAKKIPTFHPKIRRTFNRYERQIVQDHS